MMDTLKPQINGLLYRSMVIGTLAINGWAVTFGTARVQQGPGLAVAPSSPLLAVPNVTAYSSKASVPITNCDFVIAAVS